MSVPFAPRSSGDSQVENHVKPAFAADAAARNLDRWLEIDKN